MAAQALPDPFRPQPVQGLRTGGLLSVGVHAGLVVVFAALVWRSAPPQAVVAELWSALPQQAAPAQAEPEPTPPPEPTSPPPRPTPAEPPPPPPAPAAAREADIALKKAREAQARERELEQARREKAERDRLERERREKAEREKAERDKAERQKAEQEKARKEKAERERREKAERERAERAAEQRAEKMRQENLARMQKGLAGATGSAEASGTAAQSSGPSAGYAGRIRARIKPLIVYPDAGTGNPVAEVEVRLSPTGAIIGSRLLRKSGTPEWDAAVLRAVDKAEVLPRDVDGRVPPVIVLVFSPRE